MAARRVAKPGNSGLPALPFLPGHLGLHRLETMCDPCGALQGLHVVAEDRLAVDVELPGVVIGGRGGPRVGGTYEAASFSDRSDQ